MSSSVGSYNQIFTGGWWDGVAPATAEYTAIYLGGWWQGIDVDERYHLSMTADLKSFLQISAGVKKTL